MTYCNLILTRNGSVFGWGNNRNGRLGFGRNHEIISTPTIINNLNEIVKIEMKFATSYFIKSIYLV